MTEYIAKTDKNDKTLYFRVTDGKKKNVKRAEYEAAIALQSQAAQEAAAAPIAAVEPAIGTLNEKVVFEAVKDIVADKAAHKITLQPHKKTAAITYRHCVVCSLILGADDKIEAVRFMGTTLETRKDKSVFEIGGLNDLLGFRDAIVKQVEFIDWWYANTAAKADVDEQEVA